MALGILCNQASATDGAGTDQCVASGDSACRSIADIRRTAQLGAMDRYIAWLRVALLHIATRSEGGILDKTFQMDMDVDRGDGIRSRQCALRQISAAVILPDRGAGMVFTLSVHHNGSYDLYNPWESQADRG